MSNNNFIKVMFYGSLRKGEYNYAAFVNRFGEDNYIYQQTKRLKGWDLYSLGAYPTILPSEEGIITVDEFLVSPEVFDSVRSMELGAGYEEAIVNGAYIYHFTENDRGWLGEKVESGDWSSYLRQTEKEEYFF